MKLTDSILSILLFSSLFMSCQEDECLSAQNADRPSDESRTVDLAFCFSGEQRENRNVDNDIATEEGEVNNLIYAVFQNMTLRKREFVPLSEEDYNTANGKKYIVHGVDNQYLDGHSEIFAAANVSDEMKEKLMSENPDYEVPDDDPIILRLVEEQIKHEAYVYVCDNFLLPNNYASEMIPKDGKVHYFPANTNNYVSKQWDMTVLPDTWRFKTYAEFEKKKDDQNMPSEIRDIYKEIEIDLQCRVPCYKQPEYDKKRAELADKEKQDHVIRDGIKRELKQYMLWKNYAFRSDLNEEASRNDSRLIEKPLMAGYYALEGTFGTVITVPVEHVYTRIWFDFQWRETPDAVQIVVDSVVVEGILENTRIFNTMEDRAANNPSNPVKSKTSIRNKEAEQKPFLADLSLSVYPWHWGDEPQILLQQNQMRYDALCRYQWKNGQEDKSQRPNRYYVYSYQWGGVYLEDDPLVSVYYHFRNTQGSETIYKKATARLYDDTHKPGKRHHGLLRNYTYRLNCIVNTVTNKLDIQVVSVPWFKVDIDDIHPFE